MATQSVAACLYAAAFALLQPAWIGAQELEPGAYWPLPVGLNVATIANTVNWGDVDFEPAAPIDEAHATINTTALSFTRAVSLWGRSANAAAAVPVIAGHVEGLYLGQPADVRRLGPGDPRVRLALNLAGAPAMSPQAFARYRQRTIVGVSLTMAVPLGQYDSGQLLNLGTHRWSFKPEIGLSKARGPWVLEAMTGVWLFTDNTDFFGGHTRTQDPVVLIQGHLTYRFARMWLAGNANYYAGGRTTIDGTRNRDLQKNSRIGMTFSRALTPRQAIRVAVSRGAYTTIGADFTSIAIGYNRAWAPKP